MSANTWVLFALTELALCITPGPAVLYVSGQAFASGKRAGFAANLGIVSGNTIYFVASALGLGAVILASQELFQLLKWIGVAYLVWLGLRMLVQQKSARLDHVESMPVTGKELGRIFAGGTFVQLANPKTLVFFIAILPPFIDPTGSLLVQVLILGVTSQVIEFLVLGSYGLIASGAQRRLRRTDASIWVNRISGTALIAVGLGLAMVRRADG
jgi:homoserine/homoserine lactone efflux protein